MSAIRVCVIGAGAGGLVALRHLIHRAPQFEAIAYEQSPQLGGTWVYSEKTEEDLGLPIHSSMYKNLRHVLNTVESYLSGPNKVLPSSVHYPN